MATVKFENNSIHKEGNYLGALFLGTDDFLLAPLKLCGEKWHVLNKKENSSNLEKICQVAQKIILSPFLIIATSIAIIPGIFGSLVRSLFYKESYEETWNITSDSELKKRCKEIGLPNKKDKLTITKNVVTKLPSEFFSSVHVQDSKQSKIIILNPSSYRPIHYQYSFFKNLVTSFHYKDHENPDTIKALIDIILGLKRKSYNIKIDDQLFQIIAQGNSISLQIFDNLKEMHLRIYSKK